METSKKIKKSLKIPLPQPPEELKQLHLFVGKWMVEGQNLIGAPQAPFAEIIGVQTYEWLSGNFFLVAKWDRQFDNTEHLGIGIFGYNRETQDFYLTNYDNNGFMRTYRVDSYKHIWKFHGKKERATIIFSADAFTFIEEWEILDDNYTWKPLCTLKGTKLK